MTALSDCRTGTGVQVRPGQGPRGRHLPCEFDVVTATRAWFVIPHKVPF